MARIDHESGSALRGAIKDLYPLPQWAVFYEVANGMSKTFSGYADALAMGLFPSRGLDIHGFEIKTYRSDWLRELKNPRKADAIARFCDYWWLVIGSQDVATIEEIPPTWGLYVMEGKGLRVAKRAKRLKAVAPDREFVGAMLRRGCEMADREKKRVEDEIHYDQEMVKLRKQAQKDAQEQFDTDLRISTREHEALKREVSAFEEKSGIKIDMWSGARMGEAVKLIMSMDRLSIVNRLHEMAKDIEEKGKDLQEQTLQLKQVATELFQPGKIPS